MAWVAFQKRKWTFQRLQREAARESRRQLRREGVNVDVHRKSAPQTGLDGFFQKQTRSILESTWEIIQVCRIFNIFVKHLSSTEHIFAKYIIHMYIDLALRYY